MPDARREHRLHAMTTSLCSSCAATVPAKVLLCDDTVVLRKTCPEHGVHDALLEEDAAFYLRGADFAKPGTPTRADTPLSRGCPHDCGLCPDHEQHTCIGLLEITRRCDLRCPICFADADAGDFLPLETIGAMLDAYQAAEGGKAQVLQISGGEPTQHPQVLDVIALARDKGIRYVMLNTNGMRIAEDPAFARALGQFTGGFEIYLQFDGFNDAAYTRLRGRPLAALKQRALANLAEHRVPATLVATVQGGVNDGEVGRIVEFGLNHPTVRGVNFQPLAFFGRTDGADLDTRVTRTGILRRLEAQLGGMLRVDDFIPLPCDPDRVAITLLYRGRDGFIPIPRHARPQQYLPVLDNTLAFYAEDLWANLLASIGRGQVCECLSFLKDCVPLASFGAKGLLSRDRVQFATDNIFRVTVTAFLDRFTFDMKAMKQECVHVLTPDGRRIPFSTYNLFYREVRDAVAP
jgi:uncharacterized radical SAM superfamily Fe-S cluster-containing enzyme